jgi:hypothetical protein
MPVDNVNKNRKQGCLYIIKADKAVEKTVKNC